MCAADNAAHMVQGRLRSSTADAKTTAVQRHPFFLLIFFSSQEHLQLETWRCNEKQSCHRYKSEVYTNKDLDYAIAQLFLNLLTSSSTRWIPLAR